MKVQFAICAKDLPTQASYQAVVRLATAEEDASTSVLLGVTEACTATTHPVWKQLVTTTTTTTDLTDDTEIIVQVCKAYDKDDVVATATFVLGQVSGSYYQAKASFTAQQGDDQAKIALYAAEPTMGTLRFQLEARDLPDTDFGMFRKQHTDGMYEVYSAVNGKKLVRSAVVEDDLNPVWKDMELDLDVLCGGKLDAPIRITVLDKDAGDQTQYLGQVLLTVNQMLGQGDGVLKHYPLIKGGAATAQGSISVKSATLQAATVASRTAHKHLQLVLTALDAQRDKLLEQAEDKKSAAAAAQSVADTAAAAVQALQGQVDAAAVAQTTVQRKLATLKQQHATLQATAAKTPCDGKVTWQLAARDLPDTDFGIRNKTDPIYQVLVNKQSVCRSNIVENDLNPVWNPVTMNLAQLGGSLDQVLEIVVSDKDGGKNQSFLGKMETTVNKMIDMAQSKTGQALPPSKKGMLYVRQATVTDLVDHKQAAETFYQASIAPVAAECTTVTQAFEAARIEMDAARATAATAQEEAQKAQDAAEAAQLALEMMEKS